MKYYVYVLKSLNKRHPITYVGWTINLKNRLNKHNSGKGAKRTRGKKWKIIYKEIYPSKKVAMSREYFLKKDRSFRKYLRSK